MKAGKEALVEQTYLFIDVSQQKKGSSRPLSVFPTHALPLFTLH